MDSPRGVAVDSEGCVLVVDKKNHRVQKFSEDGKLLTTVGRCGNGPLEFEFPYSIAVHLHTQDIIYITEIDNQRVQERFDFLSQFWQERLIRIYVPV